MSADDIAAVAVQALTRDDPPNTEFVVTGPELLSYEDVGFRHLERKSRWEVNGFYLGGPDALQDSGTEDRPYRYVYG